MYVVVRNSDGKFVAASNSEESYTAVVSEAAVYKSFEVAMKNCCNNEYVELLSKYTNRSS